MSIGSLLLLYSKYGNKFNSDCTAKISCFTNKSLGQPRSRFCPKEIFIPLEYLSLYNTLLGLEIINICAGGSRRAAKK